jgi:hypothetical protein
VTFTAGNIPVTGVDNVDISWSKDRSTKSQVTGHKFEMSFGGKNDTRVFLYGNGTNRYIYTGLASGVPSAEYFPANGYREVGAKNTPVTAIVRQYDRQLIFKSGGEAFYSYYDTTEDIDGNILATFPTFPLSYTKGCSAPGQALLIDNDPVTVQDDVYRWKPSDIQDERNAVAIGGRVRTSFKEFTVATLKMYDNEIMKELWLYQGNTALIYGYRTDTWYKYEFSNNIAYVQDISGNTVLFMDNIGIMQLDDEEFSDNGDVIYAEWEMGYYGWNIEWMRKYINKTWIALKPDVKTYIEVSWATDRVTEPAVIPIEVNNIDYGSIDYGNWTYSSIYDPKPVRVRTKAKKWTYFKLLLKNDKIDAGATVLSVVMNARIGGESK